MSSEPIDLGLERKAKAADHGRGSDEFEADPTTLVETTFLRGPDFLKREYPNPEPLLGRQGDCLLAAGSLLLVYGPGGAAKTTWTLDGVAHLAAGREWLGLEVARPVRFVLIENEGPPGLFQAKLAEKVRTWDGEDDWIENVAVYASPWGRFTFASEQMRAGLNSFCDDFGADVVVAGPLFSAGASGAGKPEETQELVDTLVECGLRRDRAFWLAHHENKSGQVSGDWSRHPDTLVALERDGTSPRTKLTWAKARWASLPSDERPLVQLLDWIVETKSFRVIDIPSGGVSDGELHERLHEFLAANPRSSKTIVEEGVKGDRNRLRELLDEGLERGEYAMEKGSRNAQLWSLAADTPVTSLFSSTGETAE